VNSFHLRISDGVEGTHLLAIWREQTGTRGLDVVVAMPDRHESLNVVIPWSNELFNFTSKHQARPQPES